MGLVEAALRVLSYLVHTMLGLFLLALSLAKLLSGEASFKIGILPGEGRVLAYVLLALGLVALSVVYLASKRVFAIGLFLWSAAVLVTLLRGYFFSSYRFGREGTTTALVLILAAALAVAGSWMEWRRKPARLKRPLVHSSEAG